MVNGFPFTELSIGLAAVGSIVWIVRAFLNHLGKKDEAFTNTINNHLHDDMMVKERLVNSNDNLSKVIQRVLDKK